MKWLNFIRSIDAGKYNAELILLVKTILYEDENCLLIFSITFLYNKKEQIWPARLKLLEGIMDTRTVTLRV